MHLIYIEALKLNLKTFPFTLYRLVYYFLFSALAFAVFFVFSFAIALNQNLFFKAAASIAALIVFLDYWHFFRRRFIYSLKNVQVAILAEIIRGKEVPTFKAQLTLGSSIIKEKIGDIKELRAFEKKISVISRKISRELKVVEFIPNIMNSVTENILMYIFLNRDIELNTTARDGLILFQQNKRKILFVNFVLLISSYILFLCFYLLSAYVIFGIMGIQLTEFYYYLFLSALFLLWVLVYEIIFASFLVCWKTWFFVLAVENEVPSKATRNYLENISPEFNEISCQAKVFFPIKTIKERDLVKYRIEKVSAIIKKKAAKEKRKEQIPIEKEKVSLEKVMEPKIIQLKKFEEEMKRRQKAMEEEMLSKQKPLHEVKQIDTKLLEQLETQEMLKKSPEFKISYLKILDNLIVQLNEGLKGNNKIEVVNLKREGEKLWKAKVYINDDPYEFVLDDFGLIKDFFEL
ncbi:MAG: hypothetical protein AB1467_00775 [Candidatus Diapherotrites archaeon]